MNTTTTGMRIREISREDFGLVCEVVNAVFTDYPDTVENMQHNDDHRDPKCLFRRWIGELDGVPVAYGAFDQFEWMYHPRKFVVRVIVRPDARNQGCGSAMYNHVMETLMPLDPVSVRAWTREDWEQAVRFLNHRGFEEEERDWESRLDVNAFDFGPYEGVEERVREQGIEIRTLTELAGDPERDRKWWEMERVLMADVPFPPSEEQTPVSFERFQKWITNPRLLQDAYFIALDGDQYVGTSALFRMPDGDNLDTGLTGVRRDYRRRGIALALKLRAIRYAKDHGVPVIRTDNNTTNRPMLSINERLGFVKQPAWIGFRKTMNAE